MLCFFFQAEDGIRDHCVTGVQTCALPISSCSIAWIRTGSPSARRHSRRRCRSAWLAARSSGEHATFAMRYRHAITRYHAISRDITRYQIFVVAVSDKKALEGAFLRDSLTGL